MWFADHALESQWLMWRQPGGSPKPPCDYSSWGFIVSLNTKAEFYDVDFK